MKKLLFLFVPVLFTACSPRVTSSILRQQHAAPEDQTVEVFNSKEQITSDYEILGTISVDDTGFTTHCDSLLMISLAKQEVRKIGGNGFLITEHKRPSFWTSSCHRFKGVALNMSDLMSAGATNDADFDKSIVASIKHRNLPRFTFSANVGPAWKGGKVPSNIDRNIQTLYNDLKSGYQVNVSGDYFFTDNYGIRLGYQRFWSNVNVMNVMNALDGKIVMNAVYPAFVARISTNNQKWLFDISYGIGYIDYLEIVENDADDYFECTGSNVSFHFTLGAQYFVTKNLGIGVSLTGVGGVLSKAEVNDNGNIYTTNLEDDEKVSLSQTGLLFGLRYHIR